MKKWGWLMCAAPLVLCSPISGAAQAVEFSASAVLFVDSEFSDGTELGPGLALGVATRVDRPVSFTFDLGLSRTDFPVAQDELHRSFLSAILGLRFTTLGEGARFGVTLGGGVLISDDTNETDASFRSSANLETMVVPGMIVSFPVTASWGVRVFVKDQVTSWFDSIFDPDEGDLGHRFLLGAGVYFR